MVIEQTGNSAFISGLGSSICSMGRSPTRS